MAITSIRSESYPEFSPMTLRRGISNSKRLGLNPDNAVYGGVRDLLNGIRIDARNFASKTETP